MAHGFDIVLHRGILQLRAIRSLVVAFADVAVDEGLIELPQPFNVELLPVHLVCGAPGWFYHAERPGQRPWIHLAGLDPKLSPDWLLKKYPQSFGDGSWSFRLIRAFAHEIAHGLGADAERAAWRKGDAILSAALIRSPELRRGLGW